MKRREFITLIGGAAAWPLAASAQQPAMPLVGFLHPGSVDAIGDQLRAFHQGLKEVGFVAGDVILPNEQPLYRPLRLTALMVSSTEPCRSCRRLRTIISACR